MINGEMEKIEARKPKDIKPEEKAEQPQEKQTAIAEEQEQKAQSQEDLTLCCLRRLSAAVMIISLTSESLQKLYRIFLLSQRQSN